jgi:DNA-binding MurR/RpiR family transcriptional regulator
MMVSASTISTVEAAKVLSTNSARCNGPVSSFGDENDCSICYMSRSIVQQPLQEPLARRVARSLGALSPAQRLVAEHLVGSGRSAMVESASAIADQLGVSDATVVRTAQALGYSGLPELRRALAGQVEDLTLAQRLHHTLARTDTDVLVDSADSLFASVDVLLRQVSGPRFDHAVEILGGADLLLWSGIGPSAPLADYASVLARRLGRPSLALTRSGPAAADDLLELTPSSAVVVLTYGRLHPHVDALLRRAADRSVPVVLVTDVLERELADRVAETLVCWRGTPGLFASHAPTMVLMEGLLMGLAGLDPVRAETSLAQLEDLRALYG